MKSITGIMTARKAMEEAMGRAIGKASDGFDTLTAKVARPRLGKAAAPPRLLWTTSDLLATDMEAHMAMVAATSAGLTAADR